MIVLPRLYAIVDANFFPGANAMAEAAEELVAGGCTLIQYRNKSGRARVMLEQARELRRLVLQSQNPHPVSAKSAETRVGQPLVRLIMNDRADLCVAAEFDGVHVGQEDLSPEAVRAIIGPDRLLGVSTHNPQQVEEADAGPADYIAI